MHRYIFLILFSGATMMAQQLRTVEGSSPNPGHHAPNALPIVEVRSSPHQKTSSASSFWQYVPRPYVYAGLGLMPSGYAAAAGLIGGGIRVDSEHFILDASAAYDNGHKTNDNDQPNPKGHDRYLNGAAYYRLGSGWLVGAGYRWSELSTTNYTKSAYRPTFGGGKDYFHREHCLAPECAVNFSMRWQVDYVLRGNDWQNGSTGPLISIYMPSPATKGHFFFREKIGVYRFHTTVTSPSDPVLTRIQMSQRSTYANVEMTLMYRF